MQDREMSREEAIKRLEEGAPFSELYDPRWEDALALAIKALKAEPTEEQIKEYCRKRCLVIVNSELFNEMKARWSAEPVRHGRNLKSEYPSLFECSVCGWSDSDTYTGDTNKYNYCPNCGAKMDEHIDTPTDPVAK